MDIFYIRCLRYLNGNSTNGYSLPSGRQNISMGFSSFDINGQSELLTDNDEIRIFAKYLPADENFQSYDPGHLLTMQPINTQISPCNQIGGCPFVFVNNGTEFINDNNILHRSEFDENIGEDIEDKYIMRVTPAINQSDSTCQLKIKELNNDISYFDEFRLVAIDHPAGTALGITEKKEYVLYFQENTSSPEYAEHNGDDVTPELSYDSSFNKTVKGEGDDNITGTFNFGNLNIQKKQFKEVLKKSLKELNIPLSKKNKKIINNNVKVRNSNETDSRIDEDVALLIDPSESDVINWGPPAKRPAGTITAFDSKDPENPIVEQFAKRQNTSPVLITIGKNVNIDSVVSVWNSNFKISYFAITPVYYEGYIENTFDFVEATDSVNGNVLNSLSGTDQNYAVMDSATNITLKFKNTFGSVEPGFVRDYVLITNGRYENSISGNRQVVSSEENKNTDIPKAYSLYQNYPNPFNPTTNIKFDLPEDALVSIKVYDILGKEVYSFKELKPAGHHQTGFDGSNLSSGIYFYRLEAGKFIQTKRMVLIK